MGNRFLVDLEMEANLTAPADSDSLDDAVNYQQAYQIIKYEMRHTKSNLLENIGKRILDALFAEMDGIEKATIRVRKLNPPMGGPIKSVGITMSRKKKAPQALT